MRKAELLKLPPLRLTENMIREAQEDIGEEIPSYSYQCKKYCRVHYKYSTYYKAALHKGILKVAIWTRQSVMHNRQEPDYEIYCDKENDKWLVYAPLTGKWLTARVDNLKELGTDGDYYGVKIWDKDSTRQVVNDYFGNLTNYNIREAVLRWQMNIRNENLVRKHRAELEEIDSVMNEVPDLPKNFRSWSFSDALTGSHYMIYDKKTKKAHCTYCDRDAPFDKITPVHNTQGKCPICHREVTYKAWGKQKTLEAKRYTGIIQMLNDKRDFIARYFFCKVKMRRENDYRKEEVLVEDFRILISKTNFVEIDSYEYGEYRNTGRFRWIHEQRKDYYWYSHEHTRCMVMYPRNMSKLFKGTDLQYMPIKAYLDYNKGYSIQIGQLNRLHQTPAYEIYIKMGLLRFVTEQLGSGWSEIEIGREGKPWERIGVNKQGLEQLIRINGGIREVKIVQYTSRYGTKLTDEQVQWFADKLGTMQAHKVLKYGQPQKFINYFERVLWKDGADKGQMTRDYIDFLEDAEKLDIRLEKSELFPKNFQRVHAELARERMEYEDKLKQADLRKKNRMLKKMLTEMRELYAGEDEQFIVIFPKTKADFQNEGRQQHNCVGGSYFDKMIRRECCVVFLRKKEDPGKSFCTVEFDEKGEVVQNRIINNAEAPKEAQDFINEISRKAVKKIARKEREKLKKLIEAAG